MNRFLIPKGVLIMIITSPQLPHFNSPVISVVDLNPTQADKIVLLLTLTATVVELRDISRKSAEPVLNLQVVAAVFVARIDVEISIVAPSLRI